jgi:phage protein D
VHVIEGVYHDAAPPELHVQAEDALREFHTTRRTRVFENMTDAQMMVVVAQDHGLQAVISLTSPAITHAQTAQLNQSDAAFLFDRARAVGAAVWVEQQTLVVTDATPPATPNTLTYGADLATFSVRADVREQRTVSGVSGWDARTKQVLGASGSEDDLPPETTGLGWSGGRTVEATFGYAREAVVDEVPADESEAKALAVAHYRARASDFVVGRGVARNAPGLRAGRLIQLAGLGPLFSGAYQITRVCHRFDAEHGLRTEFDVRRDRIGNPRRGSND